MLKVKQSYRGAALFRVLSPDILKKMPQLIPFYFLNQLSFSFLTLLTLIFVFSKYILPLFTLQQVTRMYIIKLSNKS